MSDPVCYAIGPCEHHRPAALTCVSDTVVRHGRPTRVAVGKFFAGVIVDGIDTGAMAAGKAAEMTQDKQDPAGAVAEISPP